jgi:hypothetical protein
MSPLDKSRGGTPKGVRALQGARRARKRAEVTELRLTAFRILLFLSYAMQCQAWQYRA